MEKEPLDEEDPGEHNKHQALGHPREEVQQQTGGHLIPGFMTKQGHRNQLTLPPEQSSRESNSLKQGSKPSLNIFWEHTMECFAK